jgi:uncharacterized protein YbdZ (MbtH family)
MSRYGNVEDRITYSVIVNGVGYYSLWPASADLPPGWTIVGKTGRRQECLDYMSALMPAGQSQFVGRSAEDGGSA